MTGVVVIAGILVVICLSRANEICPPAASGPAHWWPRVLPGGGHETAQHRPGVEVVDHVSGVTP